ncbi:hypothetical protein MYO4S_00180 [Serratia phage 4S]|nr:hypothetical protein MYO4S_00180 [Serratia phage 4S]
MIHTQCDKLIVSGSRAALIGSRKTPYRMLNMMTSIGNKLSDDGIIGISGGAPGADRAFMTRCKGAIIIPYNGCFGLWHDSERIFSLDKMPTQIIIKAYLQAKSVAPWITEQKDIVQRLYSRNALQVLNLSCMSPVDFVLYWAPEVNGKVKGGTAIAVNIARKHRIPTFNLANKEVYSYFQKYLGEPSSLEDLFG